MDFQSGSLSSYYRISSVVHMGCVDIFWNNPVLIRLYMHRKNTIYKIPLENKKKAFYRLHISVSVPEIIYKISKSRVKRVENREN